MATKCVVVKVGTHVITTSENQLNLPFLEHCVEDVRVLKENGFSVIFVISGAVSCGHHLLQQAGFSQIPKSLCAGVGQIWLISQVAATFQKKGFLVAQILLRPTDLNNPSSRSDVQETLRQAIDNGVIAVMNENDSVELNGFGGNDHLASEVAKLVGASHLVILTDVEGIYSSELTVLQEFSLGDATQIADLKKQGSCRGVGGVQSKLNAASCSAQKGIETVIADGRQKNVLQQLIIYQVPLGTRVVL